MRWLWESLKFAGVVCAGLGLVLTVLYVLALAFAFFANP
jgi:hypothetical protein